MTKVLVTGGLGFIGSNFIENIITSVDCVINVDSETYSSIDRRRLNFESFKNYKFYKIDINNFYDINNIISKYSFDKVFHFAAETHVDNSIHDPFVFANTNVIGTLNILESYKNLKKNNKLFIHVSTDEVYGSIYNGKFNEKSNYKPNSPYSASKASSDLFVRSYFKTYDLPVIITNCSNNFGPYQNKEKFIPTIINSLIHKNKIPIYGTGKNIREWIFVKDHIEALMHISEKGIHGENYCIGSGTEYSNIEIVNKICKIYDKLTDNINSQKLISFVKDRKGHDFRYSLDSSKINDVGWKANNDFDKSLEQTIIWYLNNKEFLN